MKTYAFYDETGKIKKVISTTKGIDFIKKNFDKGQQYIEVDHDIKTNSHLIVDGKAVKNPDFKPELFKQPLIPVSHSVGITEKEIDEVKDIEGLKGILKQMIAPKTISFGKGE